MTRYCGREFTFQEFKQIRSLINQNPKFNRMRLSKEVCRILQWLQPDGDLKDMSCRVAMLRMHRDGLIELPPPILILPWIKSKNLASKILSLISKQLPDDWEEKYHVRPVLLESFVEKKRFAGTCYKAANWINVGQTKGRGKLGPAGKISVPIKDIWVYPLAENFRALLKN